VVRCKWRGGHLVGHVVLILRRSSGPVGAEGAALSRLLPLTPHDGERIAKGNVACVPRFRMSPLAQPFSRTRDPSLSSSDATLHHSVTAAKARLERVRG
jgi:hypothetical protein